MDRHARVTVRCHQYSAPASLVGRQVRVLLRASEVIIYAPEPGAAGSSARRKVACHVRSSRQHGMTLLLDHYLEVLARKPGALSGSTPLAQARRAGTFSNAHEAFWSAARAALGDAAGTRELVEVLLLHRHLRPEHVIAGLLAATSVGAVRADVVAVEARLAQAATGTGSPVPQTSTGQLDVADLSERVVVRLTERRLGDPAAVIAGLPPDKRELPTVDAYDDLLFLARRERTARSLP